MEYFGQYATMIVFGVTAFVAAFITMTMPESKNIKLPDTIDEAEQIGVDRLLKTDDIAHHAQYTS